MGVMPKTEKKVEKPAKPRRRRRRVPAWKRRQIEVVDAYNPGLGPDFRPDADYRPHPLDMIDTFLVVCRLCDGGTDREVNRDHAVRWLHGHIADNHPKEERAVRVTLTLDPNGKWQPPSAR
jgi:hypothetical protein